MAIIIYIVSIAVLIMTGRKYGKRQYLKHGLYTVLLYPSMYILASSIIKNDFMGFGGKLMLLYGRKRNDNLFCLHWAIKSASLIIFAVFPIVYGSLMRPGPAETAISCMMPVLGFFLPDIDLKSKIKQRKAAILVDFPVFCTDLAIMAGAGLNMPKAWKQAAARSTGTEFYREARYVVIKTETGTMFCDALNDFAGNLALPEIHTFVSIINQEIKSGSGRMTEKLRDCAKRSWKIKDDNARKKGEEATSKLVFPLILGLAGIIVILSAPAIILMKGI